MPALGINFDASRVAPAEPGSAIWEGVVPMQIERTEVADTAAKVGDKMLVLHVKSMAGEYVGQTNVIRLNLWNRNPQAAEIAQRQLSSICHCTGRMQIQDSDQLIGGQLLGVWAKEDRTVTDQTTGMSKQIPSCQCKDYKLPDGRTIKEAMSGQPASQPYDPNAQRAPAPASNSAPQAMGSQQPGFQPAGAPSLPGAQPTGTAGFVQAAGFAPGPSGGQPGPGGPGTSIAGSPSSPGFGAPAAPGGGGFQPGGAPGAAGGGFAPQGQPGAPGGFPQPQGQGGFAPQAPAGSSPAGYQPQGNGFGAPQGGQPPAAGFQPQAPGQPGPWSR